MNTDKKYETIGKVICTISYWIYAFKIILTVSIIAGIVLYLIDYPLWIAPLIGLGAFLIYRSIKRLIFRILYKLANM
ncbi:MAG: hypothetical protein J1F17_02435 [Oscillospiraceae bacterium]|nr:hypothetical protein [Oscillospiraceae bacterium]